MAEELDFDFRGFGNTGVRKDSAEQGDASVKPGKNDKDTKTDKPGKRKGDKDKHHKNGKDKDRKAKGGGKNGKRGDHAGVPALFEPMTLRGLTVRNRIWLPPMDTYSAFECDGKPTQFHYQHYVSRALGGFGMVIVEATAVCPEGRISPHDVGL